VLEPALVLVARRSPSRDRSVEGGLQSRPSAWCSGQPDAVGVRAAGRWACPSTGRAWL